MNESEVVIEFTDKNEIILFRKGESFWRSVAVHGELKYQLKRVSENWYTLSSFDGEELSFVKGRIELVNQERIRIYLHKHHDILDLADEYHRTNDFTSYKLIMEKILETPDSTIINSK